MDIMKNQKQGDINKKIIHNEENDVSIAIEYCKNSGGKTMTIGSAKSMIDSGEWQTDIQPKLPKSYKNYRVLFRFGFQYKTFKFLCELLQDKFTREICFFIYPYYKEFSKNMIVFSDIISTNMYWFRDIYNVNIKNDKLKDIFKNFLEGKIFYSSDLTRNRF